MCCRFLPTLSGGSASAGATGAVTGELAAPAIALALYGTADSDKLSPEQKANLSALAGKNAAENNNLAAVVRLGATACAEIASCRDMVVEKGLGALLGLGVAKTAMDNLSEADRTLILAAAMTGKADEIERLTPAQQAVYKEMVESQKGTLLPLPVLDRPLVDNTLTNPIPGQNKGTTLTTPDQRDQNGSSHTGNTSDVPNAGSNTTVIPIPDGPNRDDLAYQSEGSRPENMSPEGAGRAGAFNEAKRQSGIPVGKNPDRVLPNVDKRGNSQPGKIYEFDVPKPGGGKQTIQIRDDAKGHFFGEKDIQNRGPHFNDQEGNHYDY